MSQHLRNPQEPTLGAGTAVQMRSMALGSGRDTQTWLLGPGPGRLGCSGCVYFFLVSPFPFPIHIPPPSFLFLFWGRKNFLFSSEFKMACWSQLKAQWRTGHPNPRDIHSGRDRGTLHPGGW